MIMATDGKIQVVFSLDTTGSMYPCLTQARKTIDASCKRLFAEIPDLEIGIIAHGDYCDKNTSYVTKIHDLSNDGESISTFVRTVGQTGGGDAPECYELVMHEARSLRWSKDADSKVLVMVGDDVPHAPKDNPKHLNWRDEMRALHAAGIAVYGVQALNRKHATPFYKEIAEESGGFHLSLDQFAYITDMILAICYKQAGDDRLRGYEEEVIRRGRMNRSLDRAIGQMLRRAPSAGFGEASLNAVSPGRFQILDVDHDTSIKDFVLENGLKFKVGRGFYEFTKPETVQARKEVVLMDKATGDLFSGSKAREMLGLSEGVESRIRPTALEKYAVFIQSTSANRKLVGKTRFLYEVDDWAAPSD
jgi:hypothetical protein